MGTEFSNKQLIYRGEFQQRPAGRWSGNFGFFGMARDYRATGAEALSPPVSQNTFALFALEQARLERLRFQFGARLEHNGYDPQGLRGRSFTGLSAGAGVNVPLWKGGAFVANFTHSYRAPALEELYNRGPHIGNLTFEIGNPALRRETGDGIDISIRHESSRLRADFNVFHYRLGSFIYFAPTGRIEDGLPEALASQANSRFLGVEGRAQIGIHKLLWLNLGFDAVDAELTRSSTPLPRIPPLRGRVGLDLRAGSLSLRPELALTHRQDQTAPNETATAGYAAMNLTANYTFTRQHFLHVFGMNFFNVADRLCRNHLSLIKQLAPEIGRGVRFSYTLHFF